MRGTAFPILSGQTVSVLNSKLSFKSLFTVTVQTGVELYHKQNNRCFVLSYENATVEPNFSLIFDSRRNLNFSHNCFQLFFFNENMP